MINGQLITAPTKNWRFSASYDSFVVAQTFVLRMNICGKNRQLLVAANRYKKLYKLVYEKRYDSVFNNFILDDFLDLLI